MMPISKYVKGDLLECEERVIIHGCNTKNGFASGIAGAIAKRWPKAKQDYHRPFNEGMEVNLGDFILSEQYRDGVQIVIVHAMTQPKYGRDPNTVYVSYDGVREVFRRLNVTLEGCSVAIPKIGAGLGNGDWNLIEQIINEETPDLDITVYEL